MIWHRSCLRSTVWTGYSTWPAWPIFVPSIERPDQYFSTNVTGTFNVLECARKSGVKRFLYAASSSSYGIPATFPTPESAPIQPKYPYALTKYMGEELVLHWAALYGLPAISLRLFNVLHA